MDSSGRGARDGRAAYEEPRPPRRFTDDFKRQIVDLYSAGEPKREIMGEYDLGKSTVERWIKSINATGSPRAEDNRSPEQDRILELERENRRFRMEVDILKQAALIYARKWGPWRPTRAATPYRCSAGSSVSRGRCIAPCARGPAVPPRRTPPRRPWPRPTPPAGAGTARAR